MEGRSATLFWRKFLDFVYKLFNRVNSLAMVCPIIHTDRNSPFPIRLDQRTKTGGVVMCDQAWMLDLNRCRASFEEKAPADILTEAADLITGFIEIRRIIR